MSNRSGSRNILILNAGFGCGHWAAASSLQESLRSVESALQTELWELLEFLTRQ